MVDDRLTSRDDDAFCRAIDRQLLGRDLRCWVNWMKVCMCRLTGIWTLVDSLNVQSRDHRMVYFPMFIAQLTP